MSFRVYVSLLLVSVSTTVKAVKQRPEGVCTPVKIWSINAELNMDQQTADVHVLGPEGLLTERKQNFQSISNSQRQPQTHDNSNTSVEPLKEHVMEDNPVPSNPKKLKVIAVITPACGQSCDGPLAIQALHFIAQGICMLVVLSMWILLIAGTVLRFGRRTEKVHEVRQRHKQATVKTGSIY